MGRVRKIKEAVKPEVLHPGEKSLDVLNSNLKSYLKLALKEMATINTGIETSFDYVCNCLADNTIDTWLDVFFHQYKLAIGITESSDNEENNEHGEN